MAGLVPAVCLIEKEDVDARHMGRAEATPSFDGYGRT